MVALSNHSGNGTMPANTSKIGMRHMHETKRAALAGLIAASFAWAGAAAAQEIKLTLADQNSPTGWGPSRALQPWVKQVEDATKGRVKIERPSSRGSTCGRASAAALPIS